MPEKLKISIYSLVIASLSIIICYYFLDKPLVYWAHAQHLRSYPSFNILTHIPDVLHFTAFIFYPYFIIRYYCYKLIFADRALLAGANSIVIAYYLKGILKPIFGRYWPETFSNHNLSLLHDNVYGFNWFHQGTTYASFPSGHTTVVVAGMTVLILCYPRWRYLAGAVIIALVTSLIADYYHFLSDIIAGAVLGFLTAYYTVDIMKLKQK